jgi:hypothetical protein
LVVGLLSLAAWIFWTWMLWTIMVESQGQSETLLSILVEVRKGTAIREEAIPDALTEDEAAAENEAAGFLNGLR